MATFHLGPGDRGKLISIKKNDDLVITLPENPTTGYRWAVQLSGDILQIKEPPVYLSVGEAVGSGGTRMFSFAANGAGDSELTFKLHRPWERESSSSSDMKLRIHVEL